MGAAQLVILFLALATAVGAPPSEVAVGALFTYDSTIGRAAKLAIELAVDDVNSDGKVLPRTQLNLVPQDTNCSGFLGTIEGSVFVSPHSLSFFFFCRSFSSSCPCANKLGGVAFQKNKFSHYLDSFIKN
jgi:hypothetical protein